MAKAVRKTGDSSVISMAGWLGTLLVVIIPIVGLVLYLIWAFGSSGNLNRRNYCRAALILMAVSLVLGLLMQAVIAALFGSLIPMFY